MIQTNWIIITGEPRSGKSTLIERMAFKGYRICPEASRIIIDDYKSREEKLDCYTEHFERLIAEERISAEKRFNPAECVFWDRGLVDSIAFSRLYGRDIEQMVQGKLNYIYRHVFYLCELPIYCSDYATMETKESAQVLGKLLLVEYEKLGYSPIMVPQMDINSRAEFILDMIQSKEK